MQTEFLAPSPPHSHAYNDPDLSALEFLCCVYRDASLPMSIRIEAARGLLPYTEPRPARIPSSDVGCTIVIGGLGPCDPGSGEGEPEQIVGETQSFPEIADNTCQPPSGGPGPSNMMRAPEPSYLPDYSQPPTPTEIAEIKAAVQRLHPDAGPLQHPGTSPLRVRFLDVLSVQMRLAFTRSIEDELKEPGTMTLTTFDHLTAEQRRQLRDLNQEHSETPKALGGAEASIVRARKLNDINYHRRRRAILADGHDDTAE